MQVLGIGKSTVAAAVFAKLKEIGYNAELVTEYAKDCVYEERFKTLKDQVYMLGKQYHRIKNTLDSADILIVDSPILLSYIYFKYNKLDKEIDNNIFKNFTFELERSLSCKKVNIFLTKNESYFQESGRIHSNDESKFIQNSILDMLNENNVNYIKINNEFKNLNSTVESILNVIF